MIHVHRVYGLIGPIQRQHFEHDPGLAQCGLCKGGWEPEDCPECGGRNWIPRATPAREIVDAYKDPAWGEPLAAICNGKVLRGHDLEVWAVADGDDVVVLPDPEGIGAVLAWVAQFILIPAVVSFAIGFVFQALMGKPKKADERGEGEESPTYSWDGIKTGYGAGFRLPIVYGIHRVGGQVIAANVYELGNFQDVLGLLMVLSEGPIARVAGIDLQAFPERNLLGGLFNPNPNPALTLTGIRVNGNEIVDQKDLNVSLRSGSLLQSPVPRWPDVTTVYDVNFELRANQIQTYSTVGDAVTSARIRIRFQGLYKQSGNAATNHSVTFAYSFRKGAGNWSMEQQVTATAARRSRFNWSFVVALPSAGSWDIRVRRVTADDGSDTLSASTWTHIVEQFGAGNGQQLRFPNLALFALELRATERVQGSAPNVTVPIWGRLVNWWTTAGGWQGDTFQDVATSRWIGRNAAWIGVDFLTHSIYGLGRWISTSDLVLAQFEDWGDWNDELVPDGLAGTHPRHHCDLVIDAGAPAWEVVLQIFRTSQAVPILVGRQIGVKYEHEDSVAHPRVRSQVFTQANLTNFEMVWSDVRNRPNIIDAQILDEDHDWEQTMVSVEDPDAFGLNEPWRLNAEKIRRQTVQLFGVTRSAQARRLVWFMHATNRLWKSRVRFGTAVDALAVEVGDIVGVETDVVRFFDVSTLGVRMTRAGVATAVVYLDQTVTITGASAQQVAIWKTDGTVSVHDILAPVGTWPPDTALVIGAGPITWKKGAVVAFGNVDKTVRDFVVTAINLTEEMEREVWAVEYDEDAFTLPAIFELAEDPGTGISQPWLLPMEAASNVALDLFEHGTRAVVTWERPPDSRGTPARVYLRHSRFRGAIMLEDRLADEWLPVWQGLGDQAEILGLEPGETYELVVAIERRDGAAPSPEEGTSFTFTAAEFPNVSPLPATIRWVAERPEGFELAWNDARHDSTRRYEVRQGAIWDGAFVVAREAGERLWLRSAPYGALQTYQVRTVAESGLPSELEIRQAVSVGVPACKALQASREW